MMPANVHGQDLCNIGDLYNTSTSRIDSVAPEHTDEMTVCDKKYHCVRDGQYGLLWTSVLTDAHEKDYRCSVDSLHALAAVKGCNHSLTRAKPECFPPEPCLANGDGTHYCIQGDESAHMPEIFFGDMQCTAFRFNKETHKIQKSFRLGKEGHPVSIIIPRPQEQAVAQEIAVGGGVAVGGVVADGGVVEDGQGVAVGEGVADGEGVAVGGGVADGGGAAVGGGVADGGEVADGGGVADGEGVAVSDVVRCEWFRRGAKLSESCVRDEECKPTAVANFNAWWSVVGKEPKTSMREFLGKDRYINVESIFDANLLKTLPKVQPTSKAELRKMLFDFYENTPAFQGEVDSVLREEDAFQQVYGQCISGRCKESKILPATTIWDGKENLNLYLMEDDKIAYVSADDGKMHVVRSLKCDAMNTHKLCTDENVASLDAPMLQPGDPVRSVYRVPFSKDDSEHIIYNSITVARGASDSDTRNACAESMCRRNSSNCPAPHCIRTEGGDCTPNDAVVPSVRVSDAFF